MADDFLSGVQIGGGLAQRGFEGALQARQLVGMEALRQVQERAMASEADLLTQRAAELKFQTLRSQWMSDQTRSILNQKMAMDQQIDDAEKEGVPAPMTREENFIRSSQALSLVNPQAAAILRANAMQTGAEARQTAAEAAVTNAQTRQTSASAIPSFVKAPNGSTVAVINGKAVPVADPKAQPQALGDEVQSKIDEYEKLFGAAGDDTRLHIFNSVAGIKDAPVNRDTPEKFIRDFVARQATPALAANAQSQNPKSEVDVLKGLAARAKFIRGTAGSVESAPAANPKTAPAGSAWGAGATPIEGTDVGIPQGDGAPSVPSVPLATAEDVRRAFRSKLLTQDQAESILKSKFGMK